MINISSIKLAKNSIPILADTSYRWRWLPILFRLLAIALGTMHTWAAATSYSMSEDGISYLDMGDAYMRGDWNMALNSVWSPMYSWTLGAVMRISNPPMRWEFPIVQLVNLVIYLGALVCFEFFWRQLTHYGRPKTLDSFGNNQAALPEWAWLALGYTLFIWSSLTLIKVWVVTPDMLMAALVYLAAGLIVRIRLGYTRWRTFSLLGVVLGLAYLTKAVMFPISFIFLVISLFSVGNLRRALPLVLFAAFAFVMSSAPFIWAMSGAEGRLTFGDAATLTYVRYMNEVPYPHWQGEPAGSGLPEHPSRKIFDDPPIYEFGTPIGGTYPIGYDPSYWYEGVVARVDVRQQLVLVLSSVLFYLDLFLRQQGVLAVAVLIIWWMGSRRRLKVIDLIRRWGLVVVALAAFGMYALVYVEGRYIGVFVVLLWADLVANLRLPESQVSKKLAVGLGLIMVLFMLVNIAVFNLEGLGNLISNGSRNQRISRQAGPPSWPGEVAEGLYALGVQPGDKVALIGYGFGAFWARLARVQIVAEMLGWQANGFWLGDSTFKSEVLQAFASTGAKAVVAEDVPSYASLTDWDRVGKSNYYIYVFGPE